MARPASSVCRVISTKATDLLMQQYFPGVWRHTRHGVRSKLVALGREDLAVGKREVQTGGVRVYSRATASPVSETVNLREEHASVERRPVDRPATADDLKTELLQHASADMFAVSYLQLCEVSYDVVPSSIPGDVANPKTVYPWGDGYWRCTWGPALDPVEDVAHAGRQPDRITIASAM